MFKKSLRIGTEVVIDVTPLFRQSKRIYFTDGKRDLALKPEYGVYSSYLFFPVLMLFGCVWALLSKKDYFFVYSMAIVVSITTVMLLFLMVLSN